MLTRTAAPCVDRSCRTTGGYIPFGESAPERIRGLCHSCRRRHIRNGTIDEFSLDFRAPRRTLRHPAWLMRQQREQHIALRVARHESVGLAEAIPLVEGEPNTEARITNAERTAWAWLQAHPEQAAA